MTKPRSARERRLWVATGLVLLGIWASAVWAGSAVEHFGSELLLGVGFGFGFLLAIVAVVGVAAGRPGGGDLWVGVGVAACFLLIPVRAGVPAFDRTHLFEYGLLATLLYAALREHRGDAGVAPAAWVGAIVTTALLGAIDEGVQALLPDRSWELRDVGVNALAGLVATSFMAAVGWSRAIIGAAGGAATGPRPGRGPGASEE